MYDNYVFGERLTYERKKKNLSQKELAEMVGTKSSNISAYEKGTNTPSLKTACKIADALGVSLQSLITDSSVIRSDAANTYCDIVSFINSLLETSHEDFDLFITDEDEYFCSISFPFYDLEFCDFMKKWRIIHEQYKSKIIDADLYYAWLEKQANLLDSKKTKKHIEIMYHSKGGENGINREEE